MPNLRELLQSVSEPPYKGIDHSLYALLEALVEAVEPAELAKAKTEAGALLRRCHELERLLAVAKASNADAEIGQMVRGMRPHSRIIRGGKYYWPELLDDCGTWQQARRTDRVAFHDPAEALRAIQEVGDAEA